MCCNGSADALLAPLCEKLPSALKRQHCWQAFGCSITESQVLASVSQQQPLPRQAQSMETRAPWPSRNSHMSWQEKQHTSPHPHQNLRVRAASPRLCDQMANVVGRFEARCTCRRTCCVTWIFPRCAPCRTRFSSFFFPSLDRGERRGRLARIITLHFSTTQSAPESQICCQQLIKSIFISPVRIRLYGRTADGRQSGVSVSENTF